METDGGRALQQVFFVIVVPILQLFIDLQQAVLYGSQMLIAFFQGQLFFPLQAFAKTQHRRQ